MGAGTGPWGTCSSGWHDRPSPSCPQAGLALVWVMGSFLYQSWSPSEVGTGPPWVLTLLLPLQQGPVCPLAHGDCPPTPLLHSGQPRVPGSPGRRAVRRHRASTAPPRRPRDPADPGPLPPVPGGGAGKGTWLASPMAIRPCPGALRCLPEGNPLGLWEGAGDTWRLSPRPEFLLRPTGPQQTCPCFQSCQPISPPDFPGSRACEKLLTSLVLHDFAKRKHPIHPNSARPWRAVARGGGQDEVQAPTPVTAPQACAAGRALGRVALSEWTAAFTFLTVLLPSPPCQFILVYSGFLY